MSAFEGIRVIDCSTGIAGAMATMFLADFGAEVVRVEPPGGGALAQNPGALCWNRNKLRFEADLEQPGDRARVVQLLAGADACVLDYGPADMRRLGLEARALHELHTGLLHAWLAPYGLSQPWADLPPDDGLLSALTGIAQLQATSPDRPVRLVTPQAAYAHGLLGGLALACGLLERRRTGRGRALVVTGLHAVSAIEGGALAKSAVPSRVFGRGVAPNYRLYQCKDGEWLFFGALTEPFFRQAIAVLQLTELMAEPAIDGAFTRMLDEPGASLAIASFERRFSERPAREWDQLLHDAGVPVARVGSREEWFRSETVGAHGMRVVLEDERLGAVEIPGVPVELSETPGTVRHLMRTVPALSSSPARRASPALSPSPLLALPLAGLRVLDLGGFVAGPFVSTLLAAFGADVIKVEPPAGDPFRTYGLTFVAHNRGKRGAVIDLKSGEGPGALRRLVSTADVLVENYRPGVRERLGIGDDVLRRWSPGLVVCSITGYGGKGPFANDPGFDPVVQAQGGFMRAQGGDGPPVFHQIAINDTAAALCLAFGAVAALVARQRTGRGQIVRTNLAVQAVLCQSGELTSYPGRRPALTGGPDFPGPRALERLYRCKDGWLSISAGNIEQARALGTVLFGNRGTIPDGNGGFEAEKALGERGNGGLALEIERVLGERSRSGTIAELLRAGVPCAPALTLDEIIAEQSLAADGLFDEFEYAEIGRITGVAGFATWDGVEAAGRGTAPLLGEHTAEVLSEAGTREAW